MASNDLSDECTDYSKLAIVGLPLITLSEIVVFPGDQLPLRLGPGCTADLIKSNYNEGVAIFAAFPPNQEGVSYGTTVRIEILRNQNNGIYISGTARQRFRLIKTVYNDTGVMMGVIEILVDQFPGPVPAVCNSRFEITHWSRDIYESFDVGKLIRRIFILLNSSEYWKWFALDTTNCNSALLNLHKKLQDRDFERDAAYMEAEIAQFSYWLAANLQMNYSQRLGLHRLDNVVHRLQHEINMLEKCQSTIFCVSCEVEVGDTRDIFNLSNCKSAMGTFTNPYGYIHEIMTLRSVHTHATTTDMLRCEQDSWFAGYAWSILHCRSCFNHLGWRFDINDINAVLELQHFYAFRRAAVSLSSLK